MGRELLPANENERGCQVSMLVLKNGKPASPSGREIFDALLKQGVITDWREPNVIRVAAVPLYNTFEDVWRFGEIVRTTIGKI